MRIAVALVIGYLLGAVLPAYFIGRQRGIDLRYVGSGNAGTTNAYHVLGLGPAIVTVSYDALKGILAMLFAWRLGVPDQVIYAAGLAAWAGHHYPFYLGYHGAEGAATTAGLLAAAAAIALGRGWLTPLDFAAVAVVMLVVWAVVRLWPAAGIAGLVAAYGLVLYHSPSLAFDVFVGAATAHQLVHNTLEVRKRLAWRSAAHG
jgi:acyl phosphate:glycerol-3-phosphate acyltransferase